MDHGKTPVIGLVVDPNIQNYVSGGDTFYWRLLTEIQRAAGEHQCYATLVQPEKNLMSGGRLRLVEEGVIDFLIVHSWAKSVDIYELCRDVPTVVIAREIFNLRADSVLMNYSASVYEQFEYLRSLGHENVTIFRPRALAEEVPSPATWAIEKFLAIAQLEARNAGVTLSPSAFHPWKLDAESERQVTNEFVATMLQESPAPTAILTYDLYIPAMIELLKEQSLSVPTDISIIGTDDDTHGRPCPISLTTVRWNFQDLADASVELLLRRIKNPAADQRTVKVKPHLKKRQSTGRRIVPGQESASASDSRQIPPLNLQPS